MISWNVKKELAIIMEAGKENVAMYVYTFIIVILLLKTFYFLLLMAPGGGKGCCGNADGAHAAK